MRTTKSPTARTLVLSFTRLLIKVEGGGYDFPGHVTPRLGQLVDAAAAAPTAAGDVGALLKLVAVLRGKRQSPGAAATLTRVLKASPGARRIIALHWSGGGRRPRVGADLMPIKTGLAPHIDARPAQSSLRASSFLRPGGDLRSAHLQKTMTRNKS